MSFNREKFKRVFDHSGLTKNELKALYGVSRQTLYSWADAGHPSNSVIDQRAGVYTDALINAMDKNMLPLPASLDRAAREQRLARVAQTLHKLNAPK